MFTFVTFPFRFTIEPSFLVIGNSFFLIPQKLQRQAVRLLKPFRAVLLKFSV